MSTTVRYEAQTTIDRPIGEVFARLADLDGYGTWMHRTGMFRRAGKTSHGPLGPATEYVDATRMGTFRGQITDYQEPSQIAFRETLRWSAQKVVTFLSELGLIEGVGRRLWKQSRLI